MCVVVEPGLEPRQTGPKPVVLPLHHSTVIGNTICLFAPFRVLDCPNHSDNDESQKYNHQPYPNRCQHPPPRPVDDVAKFKNNKCNRKQAREPYASTC